MGTAQVSSSESFEYFCQMSSKSILIISSYTVSKLGAFIETQCDEVLGESPVPSHCVITSWSAAVTLMRARVRPVIHLKVLYTRRPSYSNPFNLLNHSGKKGLNPLTPTVPIRVQL